VIVQIFGYLVCFEPQRRLCFSAIWFILNLRNDYASRAIWLTMNLRYDYASQYLMLSVTHF